MSAVSVASHLHDVLTWVVDVFKWENKSSIYEGGGHGWTEMHNLDIKIPFNKFKKKLLSYAQARN